MSYAYDLLSRPDAVRDSAVHVSIDRSLQLHSLELRFCPEKTSLLGCRFDDCEVSVVPMIEQDPIQERR